MRSVGTMTRSSCSGRTSESTTSYLLALLYSTLDLLYSRSSATLYTLLSTLHVMYSLRLSLRPEAPVR